MTNDGILADFGILGSSHSAANPSLGGISPANGANSVESSVAFLVAKSSIILETSLAAHGVRGSDDDLFGAGEVEPSIHAESPAVRDGGSADAASDVVISRFAFGVDDEPIFLTLSFSVVFLTSAKHSMIIETISEFPGVSASTSIFSVPAEETVVSEISRAVLVAVKAKCTVA